MSPEDRAWCDRVCQIAPWLQRRVSAPGGRLAFRVWAAIAKVHRWFWLRGVHL